MSTAIEKIRELRELTGMGVGSCKEALHETDWDVQESVQYFRKRGLSERLTTRVTSEGRVMSYVHGDVGRVGVLLQVNCETDFVARGEEFREFMHEVCLQIASMKPTYISRDDVLTIDRDQTRLAFALKADADGKPEKIIERIVEGQLNKWYAEVCLLDQVWVKEKGTTINDLLTELCQKTGERITVVKFSRFEAGTE